MSQIGLKFDKILSVNHSDLGLSRNSGISASRGEFISFLDGDDLYSENWLTDAFLSLKENTHKIAHPEVNVFFDKDPHWWRHINQKSIAFLASEMIGHNYWTALSFAHRSVYMKFPYQQCARTSGFGYEDWHWNCETIEGGLEHCFIPRTTHFIRIKSSESLNHFFRSQKSLIRPTKYFLNHARFSSLQTTSSPRKMYFYYHLTKYYLIQSLGLWKAAASFSLLKPIHFLIKRLQISNSNRKIEIAMSDTPSLPPWAIDSLWTASKWESLLFPSKEFLQRLKFRPYQNVNTIIGQKYPLCIKQLKTDTSYSHVFVIPWIIRGGADLASLHHINTLSDIYNKKCLIITTENRPSTWLHRISKRADILELGISAQTSDIETIAPILARLLVDLKPKVIHIMQSLAGWEVVKAYGRALSQNSNLFASVFCDDFTNEGEPVGYARSYLRSTYPYFRRVFSDQKYYPNLLENTYGIEPEYFQTLYFPTPELPRPTRLKTRKVLWAGRLDRQKRPDILFSIAREMPHITFDVWGVASLDIDSDFKLENLKNINLKGPYDGFSAIPLESYEVFLYTSQWDGLPNVLLEAASAGLPIVAPMVGGISELISEETGFPIKIFDNVDEYVHQIDFILNNPTEVEVRSLKAKNLVATRHSYEFWQKQLEEVPCYIKN